MLWSCAKRADAILILSKMAQGELAKLGERARDRVFRCYSYEYLAGSLEDTLSAISS